MKVVLSIFSLILFSLIARAQTDTTQSKSKENTLAQQAIRTVKRTPKPDNVAITKSEDAFIPFEGKIIRNIIINKVGFEKSIYDSTRSFKNSTTRLANAMHANTREGVIRDNLFFRKNKPLNPYRVADNERHLRDLDFILDSKIEVCEVAGSSDSVDVEVFVRDVFSIGIKFDPEEMNAARVDVYDVNLFGQGQRVQVNTLFDAERSPQLGMSMLYRKSSLAGSLVNPSIGYTQINSGRSYGTETEHAYFVRLDRPLVSPYTRMAGGVEVSKNYSMNNYEVDTAAFRKYRYHLEDFWVGYNMGIYNTVNSRERHFLAMRYFNQNFERKPEQVQELTNPLYNNQQYLLGSITFYEQNFYKTKYVYGFGRTEDVPIGKTLSFTGGWSSEFGVDRSYLGFNTSRDFVTSKGNFYKMAAGGGSFFRDDKTEDTFIFANGQYYSRLCVSETLKVRQLVEGGYAQAFNNSLRPLLTLNNQLFGFKPDSLYTHKRAFLRTETTLFTNWKVAGFNFAGFVSLESAFFQLTPGEDLTEKFIYGTTGGFRIRNENITFGTIEFRAYYFPTDVAGVDTFSFRISTNVRLKYTSTFVRPPSFVTYN